MEIGKVKIKYSTLPNKIHMYISDIFPLLYGYLRVPNNRVGKELLVIYYR